MKLLNKKILAVNQLESQSQTSDAADIINNAEHLPVASFQTKYCSGEAGSKARKGLFQINGVKLQTPALFPVMNLLSGPPSLHRNGATYKFLKKQLIFEDHRPNFLTEALHFTDYPFNPRLFQTWFPHAKGIDEVKTLDYWVKQSFIELGKSEQNYKPLFFLDSGGFRLLFNREMDIADYGYEATQDSILRLQLDYGADMVASLDFPIPPMLNSKEVEERINKSINNALRMMFLLYRENWTDPNGKRPFPILAIHGQTPQQIQQYITRLFEQMATEGYNSNTTPFGLGIGSLVPLRNHNPRLLIMIVKAVTDLLRGGKLTAQFESSQIPIHTFGITGDMIPILSYMGVDTFDSSSYVKSASVLDYYNPVTWISKNFYKLDELPCNCRACSGIDKEGLAKLQEVLKGKIISGNKERLGLEIGNFKVDIKSDVYGLIAYHNLQLQDEEIERLRQAIQADETASHIVSFGKNHTRSQDLIEFLSEIDPEIAQAAGHVQIELFPRAQEEIDQHFEISLNHNPDAFDLQSQYPEYEIPNEKDRLLLIACAQAKPYRTSKSHSSINRFLKDHVGDNLSYCHKVSISGLYGPVPLEFEDLEAVRTYEYRLDTSARRQSQLVTQRLKNYLLKHSHKYKRIVAYITINSYRRVVEQAFEEVKQDFERRGEFLQTPLLIAPAKSKGAGTKDLLTHVNLQELVNILYPEVELRQSVVTQLKTE